MDWLDPPAVAVLRGPRDEIESWRAELDRIYAPSRRVFAIPDDAGSLPGALADKRSASGAVAYVCRGMTCSEPIRSLSGLISLTRS